MSACEVPECWLCLKDYGLHLKRESAAMYRRIVGTDIEAVFQAVVTGEAESALVALDRLDASPDALRQAQGMRRSCESILAFLKDFPKVYDAQVEAERTDVREEPPKSGPDEEDESDGS